MPNKDKERRGGAAGIPLVPVIMKNSAGWSFQALMAGKSGMALMAAFIGVSAVGGYQALDKITGGAMSSKKSILVAGQRSADGSYKESKDGKRGDSLSLAAAANRGAYGTYSVAASPAGEGEDSDGEEYEEYLESGNDGTRGEDTADGGDKEVVASADKDGAKADKPGEGKETGANPQMDAALGAMAAGGTSAGGAPGGAGGSAQRTSAHGRAGKLSPSADGDSGGKLGKAARAKTGVQGLGGKTGGGGGAGTSSLNKLRNMKKDFGGTLGRSDSGTQYATLRDEWDGGGTPITGAGADEDTQEDSGKKNSVSSSEGGDNGSPYNNKRSDDLGGSDEDSVGNIKNSVNITPYQQMVDMAQVLLKAVSVLLLLSFILGLIGKAWPAFYTVAKYVAYLAAALAAIVTLLGVGIMAQGQVQQGALFLVVGAVLTGLSYVSAEGYGEAANSEAAVKSATEAETQAMKNFVGPQQPGVVEANIQAAGKAAATKSAEAGTAATISTGVGSASGWVSSDIADHNAGNWEQDYKESSGWQEQEDYNNETKRLMEEDRKAMRDLEG